MPRVRRNRAQWSELIAELENSGLSVTEFAKKRRLTRSSVHRWRSILGKKSKRQQTKENVSFVEVMPSSASIQQAEVWLELSDKLVLRFSCLPDPAYLAQITSSFTQ